MGPMATTPTSCETEMEADMYFCTTSKTRILKPKIGVFSDY